MKQRIITALVLLCIGLPMVWVGGKWMTVGISFAAIVALSEICGMAKITFPSIEATFATVAMIILIVPNTEWLTADMKIFAFGLVIFSLLAVSVFSNNEVSFEKIALLCLSAVYLGISCHYILETRRLSFWHLLFVLLVTWATDIGAYLSGSRFGKRKLAPKISPNKTVEGFIGGIGFAVVGAIIFLFINNLFAANILRAVLIAIVISIAGQLGDLVESAMKRYYGVKDSGNLLPGHGGVLDRFDSFLFAATAFHAILAAPFFL